MNPIFTKMVDAVEAANAAPDDYINSADGLKYCGKCHTPKEAFYPADLQAQGFTKHPVMCKCVAERREREEAERREYERMSYMTMLRSEAFRDMPAAGWRFESAAVTTPQLAKARGYAQNWDEFKKAGIGLLLFGNVGAGKSYAAGCIANALIDRLESVLFVGMSDVVNRMQGNFGSDRDNYMKSLMRPDLLILDDLGAERNTSFGKERVFDVVDKRLLTGKPMIVTTNIPLSVMKQAADLDAVSYTHLDVYKRQVYAFSTSAAASSMVSAFGAVSGVCACSLPVSYTHLWRAWASLSPSMTSSA